MPTRCGGRGGRGPPPAPRGARAPRRGGGRPRAGPAGAGALGGGAAGGTGPARRAAAIPALEAVSPVDAADVVELLAPALADANEGVRLAAARALADRRPKASAEALVGLLKSDDAAVRSQAAGLLQRMSGLPREDEADAGDFAAAAGRGGEGAASPAADPPPPLGRQGRLAADRFGAIVAESFADAKADVTGGYRQFRYE